MSPLTNIAKYTGLDNEITSLPQNQQVDYAYYILGYPDPNANQQMNQGIQALNDTKNPINLLYMLQHPKKFGMLMTAIAIMLVIVSAVIFICFFVFYQIRGDRTRKLLLMAGGPVLVGIFIIMILLTLLSGSISKEITRAYIMLPPPSS